MTSPELPEFLSARIAEDEAALDGDRWMAECNAKRRIVAEFEEMDELPEDERVVQLVTLWWVMECLALPYADHPDYDVAWTP